MKTAANPRPVAGAESSETATPATRLPDLESFAAASTGLPDALTARAVVPIEPSDDAVGLRARRASVHLQTVGCRIDDRVIVHAKLRGSRGRRQQAQRTSSSPANLRVFGASLIELSGTVDPGALTVECNGFSTLRAGNTFSGEVCPRA